MNKLGWVVLLLVFALALAAYQGRARHAPPPAAASTPAAADAGSAAASAPAAARPHAAVGGSPLTEPSTTADMFGTLSNAQTAPHLEDAAQKARNAMRNMHAAEDRERAALGGGSKAPAQRPDEP